MQKMKPIYWLALAALLLGLALRLIDLTDPPLAYFPEVQYHSAMLAAGRDVPAGEAHAGLPVMEGLAGLFGANRLLVGRIVNVFAWIVGGGLLYALLGRQTSPRAALLPLLYYLFVPVALESSRAFLPQTFMLCWLVAALYGLFAWLEMPQNSRMAWLAAIAGLIAGLTHFSAVYVLLGVVAALLLSKQIERRTANFWPVVGLGVVMPGLVQLASVLGGVGRWGLAARWYLQPAYYVQWLNRLNSAFGWMLVLVALAGVLLAEERKRALLLGLWGGYLAYGLAAPAQVTAENYFHLPLLPILALSLVGLAEALMAELAAQTRPWQVFFAFVVFIGVGYPAWNAQEEWLRVDHRGEPAFYAAVAEALPEAGAVVAFAEADALPLQYYGGFPAWAWLAPNQNLTKAELKHYFSEQTAGVDYFVVTRLGPFNQQTQLAELLHENFPLLVEGDGYLIFDLR